MRPRTALVRVYVLTALVTAIAVAARWMLDPILHGDLPLVTLFGAVAFGVWIGGWGPAVLAVLGGYLACDFLFIEPRQSFAVREPASFVGFVAYLVTCAIIIAFGEALRASQRTARERAESWRTTLSSIGDGVILTDVRGAISFMNGVAESLTGWPLEEARGKPLDAVFRLVREENHEPAENPAAQALREETVTALAHPTLLVARDGTERSIDDSAAPIRDAEGRTRGCVLVFRDVTERRREDVERREQAARLAGTESRIESVLDNLIDGIITIDENGVVQTFSRAAERIFGYEAAAVIGRNVSMLMPEPDRSAHDSYLANYFATGEAKIIGIGREVLGLRSDGSTFPMDLAVSEFRLGGRRHFSGIVRDITARREAEDALRESEKRLRLALDAGRMGTWSWNLRTNEVSWSSGLEEIHGLAPGTFAGNYAAFESDIHPDDRDGVRSSLERTLHTSGDHHIEYRVVRPDGTMRWVEGQGQLFRDADGTPQRMVGICRDITDRKSAEDALRASEQALKVADRRKDEFLAMLAHELRNPLATLAMGAQLLTFDNPELREQASAVIQKQLRLMIRLVDDLLDVSRISEGKLELRREEIDLACVMQDAIEISRPAIEQFEHRLEVRLPEEPMQLHADPVRLAQVFANLLNNAAKYTERSGNIHLTTARAESGVMISIRDDGIGIPAEALPRIFEMFMQAGPTNGRSRGGLGIGLTLVKRLVELHGGSVEARSDGAGQGSEFIVRLPIRANAEFGDSTATED